jgi:hypothetical protein
MNHFRVLRHYGVRMLAPDRFRSSEYAAWRLWNDAMMILSDVLIAKNIVLPSADAKIVAFDHYKAQAGVLSSW